MYNLCKTCGKKLSGSASTCVSCGDNDPFQVQKMRTLKKKAKIKAAIYIAISVAFVILGFILSANTGKNIPFIVMAIIAALIMYTPVSELGKNEQNIKFIFKDSVKKFIIANYKDFATLDLTEPSSENAIESRYREFCLNNSLDLTYLAGALIDENMIQEVKKAI